MDEKRERILVEMAEKLGVPRDILGMPPVPDVKDWRLEVWEHFADLIQDALAVSQMQQHLDEKFGPGKYKIVYDHTELEEPLLTQFIRVQRSGASAD